MAIGARTAHAGDPTVQPLHAATAAIVVVVPAATTRKTATARHGNADAEAEFF
jgi:hypothetical protein